MAGNPLKGLFRKKPKAESAEKPGKKTRDRAVPAPAALAPADPSISELFQPQKKVAGPDLGRLPRFKTTAGDQLDPRLSDRFAQLRMRVRNAFTPSRPVSDRRLFAGRRDVLSHMIRSLEDQRQHLVLYGERGIGKTSLLHILSEAAREARYIVVYWSCGAASNFDETFRAAAAEVPLLFHSGFAPTTQEAETGSSLADLLPATRISPRVFGDLCARITGTRVLIVLDEFDRCESAEFRREVAELMKILSDRSVRTELVIAGVAADLAELVEHIPSIRRNIQAFRIPLMDEAEVRELVQTGGRSSGMAFAAPAEDLVVAACNGSPYLASLICHHASLSAIDNKRPEVSVEDVAAGVGEACSELRERIPKVRLNQLDRMLEKGAGPPLAVLASAAITAGGPFDDLFIQEAAGSAAAAALTKRLAQELAEEGDLLRISDQEGRRRYLFIDEGLPPYLLLMNVSEGAPAAGDADNPQRAAG